MKKTREQRRAKLAAKADEIIECLLDWTEETEKPNLTQIEDVVLKLRGELSIAMLETVVDAQESVQPAEAVTCPKCGRPMRYKGRRDKQLESRAGAVDLARGYYACPRCERGLFPPG